MAVEKSVVTVVNELKAHVVGGTVEHDKSKVIPVVDVTLVVNIKLVDHDVSTV